MEEGFELTATRARVVRLWEETDYMTNRYSLRLEKLGSMAHEICLVKLGSMAYNGWGQNLVWLSAKLGMVGSKSWVRFH
jgi:hypothetical protein